jgi:putative addiction module component (TIGR02574 family)
MADPFADLAERAKSLEPEDRVRLVELLLDSLHDEPIAEVEAAWEEEIRQRVAALERGEVETHAAEDVFAEARRIAS